MDDLIALAERCEAATGADRELDAAIVRALYPEAIIDIYCAGDDEPTVFHAAPLVPQKGVLPCFTASLDAAMALIPEGHAFGLGKDFLGDERAWAWCSDRMKFECRKGASVPLALTAASLRARAAALKLEG